MKPERWRKVEQLYHAALELDEDQRSAFLNEACAGDEALRSEVDSLLGFDDSAETFIESPALEVAARLFVPAEEGFERVEQQDAQAAVERIGAYRIINEVGRGGMGTVYLAERDDDEYHNQVAIKLIKRGMDSDAILYRFRTERQILARLNHPNIARMLDGGTTSDGRPYFVMEYIEGRPIDDYADKRRLSITERLELFLQVCLAIQYSHQHLVVHRDIKPSNIIVTADGTVKLLDFGIAKLVTPDTGVAETQSAAGWMTPEYSSPEQLRSEPVTTASDVYSLGVVLYELLAGRRPYRFEERSPNEMVEMILNSDPERPSTAAVRIDPLTVREGDSTQLSPDAISESRDETPDKLRRRLSGDLDNIVLKAMHREKDLRYRSVTELAQDIRRHLEGHPVLARKDSLSYRTWKFIGRNRLGVAAAALLILTLTGGIIATAWQARVARRAQATSERRFQDVRKLAHSVVFDYHDAIKDLAGSTPVREKLVSDALEYLNSLALDAEQDASLKAEIADAYEKISSIQGGRGVANLGDSAGAIESLKKCQQIRQSLLEQNPQDPGLRMKVADANRSLAALLRERDDTEGAAESYRKAVEISEGLISIDPTNSDFKYQAASSYAALGDFLVDLGDWHGAVENEQKALGLFQSIPSDGPQSGTVRRSMGTSYVHLSTALRQLDDLAGSEKSAAKSIEIFIQLSRENPTDAYLRRRVGVSHFFHGEALESQKRHKEALDSFRQYAAIAEELSAADPRNVNVLLDRAFAYGKIGAIMMDTRQNSEAASYFRRSLDIRRSVYEADPDNLYKRNPVIAGTSLLIGAYTESGNISAAVAESRKLIEMLTEDDDNSELAYVRGATAAARDNIASAFEAASARASLEDRKRLREQTRAQYQKCLDILLDMQSKGTLYPSDLTLIEKAKQGIARCR